MFLDFGGNIKLFCLLRGSAARQWLIPSSVIPSFPQPLLVLALFLLAKSQVKL